MFCDKDVYSFRYYGFKGRGIIMNMVFLVYIFFVCMLWLYFYGYMSYMRIFFMVFFRIQNLLLIGLVSSFFLNENNVLRYNYYFYKY